MRGLTRRFHLIAIPHHEFARAPRDRTGRMDLDPVGAELDVAAGPKDDLVDRIHHLGVADRALVGDQDVRPYRRQQSSALCTPVFIRGPLITPASIASRIEGPTPCAVSRVDE